MVESTILRVPVRFFFGGGYLGDVCWSMSHCRAEENDQTTKLAPGSGNRQEACAKQLVRRVNPGFASGFLPWKLQLKGARGAGRAAPRR